MDKRSTKTSLLNYIKTKPYRFSLWLALLLVISLFMSNSYITRYFIIQWFQDKGANIDIQDLTLSIVDSKIEVIGFSAHKDQRYFEVKSLKLDWQWWPLLDNHFIIDDFKVTGLKLDLQNDNNQLQQVGPISIDSPPSDVPVDKPLDEESTWQVSFFDTAVEIAQLCIHGHNLLEQPVSQSFLVQPEISQLTNKPLCFNSQIDWAGEGTLVLADTINASTQGSLQINNSQLRLAQDILFTSASAQIQQLSYQQDTLLFEQLLVKDTYVGSSPDHLTQAQSLDQTITTSYALSLGQLVLNNFNFDITQQALNTKQLSLTDLSIDHFFTSKYSRLANIGELKATLIEQSPKITSLENISLKKIHLLENSSLLHDQDNNYFTGLNSASSSQIKLNPDSLSVEKVEIDGMFANIVIDQQGNPDIQRWLNINAKQDPEDLPVKEEQRMDESAKLTEQNAPEATEQLDQPFSFLIGLLALNNSQDILFADFSSNRKSYQKVSELAISLDQVNNLGEVFNSKVSATVNESGSLTFSGPSSLQKNKLDTAIKGSISNLNLGGFSKYSERFIGYRIDQGRLNTDLEFNIKNSELDSVINLNFNKFELGYLEQHEQHPLNEELGVPLPLALNLLRDSDNNIDIELPITGNVDDPDFSINDIVTTISVKAIKSAIIYQYSPFGLLTLASGAIDLATGLSFDPIVFAHTSYALNNQHTEQLESIAKLMSEKPQLSFVICGQSSIQDLPQNLLPNETLAENKASDSSNQSALLTEEQRDYLLNLANKRQSIVATYLTAEKSIPKEQIILCNVKLGDVDEQSPLVNIKI